MEYKYSQEAQNILDRHAHCYPVDVVKIVRAHTFY